MSGPLRNGGIRGITGTRRATFADQSWEDPVTDGNGKTRSSVPGKTFQSKLKPLDIDMHIPSAQFSGGLPVALFVGSVRMIRHGVSENVYWAAITPAGGEVSSLD